MIYDVFINVAGNCSGVAINFIKKCFYARS
jgi:hypothetical protein